MKKIIKIFLVTAPLIVSQISFAAESVAKAEQTPPAATVAAPSATSTSQVNINTADAATLSKMLDGIGDVKAKAIVDYRTQNGPFKTVDDLAKVTGIGAATLEKNKNKIVLQ